VGISKADLPKVFEAFFTTRNTVGNGIGLFIAKQFVEGHGGQIEVESSQNAEDHGTTVRVFLPISTAYDSPGKGASNWSGTQNGVDRPLGTAETQLA
jgi:signal transduction histidine kinase